MPLAGGDGAVDGAEGVDELGAVDELAGLEFDPVGAPS